MFKFQTIKDFITTLNRNQKLLTELFNKRNISLQYDDFVNSLEEHEVLELDKLIDGNIVNVEGGMVNLESELGDFFETFLDVRTTINTGMVQDIINNIQQEEAYYLEEQNTQRREGYLKKIKKGLKKLEQVVLGQVRILWESIEQVYKTEVNLKIKLSKLNDFRDKRDTIERLVSQLEEMFNTSTLYNSLIDRELKSILLKLKSALIETKKNLLGIQESIIIYLAKVQQQSSAYEKLQKIKYLKDQYDLRAKSNIAEVLSQENGLFFSDRIRISTLISITHLQTDEGYKAIKKVHQKKGKPNKTSLKLAKPIPDDFFNEAEAKEFIIDIENLKNVYVAQGGDLFTFVQRFEFEQSVSDTERLTIFCKLISMYDDLLEVSDEMETAKNGVEYAKVRLK